MKTFAIAILIAAMFSGCATTAKDIGGGMMNASGSAGFAGLITFPIGGLIYLGGSAAEEADAK